VSADAAAEIKRLSLVIGLAEARAALIHFDLEALDAARKEAPNPRV